MVKKFLRSDCDGKSCSLVRLFRCEKCGKEYKEFVDAMNCEKGHRKDEDT